MGRGDFASDADQLLNPEEFLKSRTIPDDLSGLI